MAHSKMCVSIIVPVFNHESYIEACLGSVFQQTYPHLELVVIDDGSTDRSPFVVEETLEDAPCPAVFQSQENQGSHAAINKGIELAEGQYIAILNSDDRFHPRRLEVLLKTAKRTGSRFLFTGVRHIGSEGETLPPDAPHPYYFRRSVKSSQFFPRFTFELLRQNMAISSGNFFFHRSLYDEAGPFRDLVVCDDWDFLLRALLIEDPVFVDQPLLDYRIHPENTTKKYREIWRQEIDRVLSDYLQVVPEASNPRVPGPDTWETYWPVFVEVFLEHLNQYPRTWQFLQDSKTAGIGTDEPGLIRAYSRWLEGEFRSFLEKEKTAYLNGYQNQQFLSKPVGRTRRRLCGWSARMIEILF